MPIPFKTPTCPTCGSRDLTLSKAPASEDHYLSCTRCTWAARLAAPEVPEDAAAPQPESKIPPPCACTALASEQPAPPPPPAFDFRPKPNESPYEKMLSQRRMQERLRQFGIGGRTPELSHATSVLTPEEIAARDQRPAEPSQEEQRRDANYRKLAARAGITPSGIVFSAPHRAGR